LFLQTPETIHKEAFPPAPDHLTAGAQTSGNLVVVESLGGQENHLGTLDLKIR